MKEEEDENLFKPIPKFTEANIFFPKPKYTPPPGVKLQMRQVGLYSAASQSDTRQIVFFMRNLVLREFKGGDLKKLSITDATGGVGTDSIAFAKLFHWVCCCMAYLYGLLFFFVFF